jgi:hypothetical protein
MVRTVLDHLLTRDEEVQRGLSEATTGLPGSVAERSLSLAEAANLLKVPGRHMALPEQANSKTAPDAPELTPVQIETRFLF